jgi:JmjC domain, hydroxylase
LCSHFPSTDFNFSAGWALNIAIGPANGVLAIWWFVHPDDFDKLEEWVQKKGCSLFHNNCFVTDAQWVEIEGLGIKVTRVEQHAGDSILVPLGAPHQVLNVKGMAVFFVCL